MAWLRAPTHLQCSIVTLRTPAEVSLPMPMHANVRSLKVQLEMCTSSHGRLMVLASAPRPDLSEMQSSLVSNVQPSIVTFLHESTSMPSAPEWNTTFLKITFSQYTGCVDHMPVCTVKQSSTRTLRQFVNSS